MSKALRVLFLDEQNCCESLMAERLFRSMANSTAVAESAGFKAGTVRQDVVASMAKVGIDVSDHLPKTVIQAGAAPFDLVITLGEKTRRRFGQKEQLDHTPLLVGAPIFIHWQLPDESDGEPIDGLRDTIRDHAESLVRKGYLDAVRAGRQITHRLIDSLNDGIVVHDASRRIFLFNKAAEQITGLAANQAFGRTCQNIFPPDGFCGSQCPFHDHAQENISDRQYKIPFTASDGTDKRLAVTHTAIDLGAGMGKSVLITLRDVTEVSELRWKLERHQSFHGMVGISRAMKEVFETIRQVTTTDYPVLITGESGTGKELVASAIHHESRRKGGPFVPINCGALPESILESELFGHVRGAFTGAIRDKKGRFELAHKGTLFLDEVGELTPAFQVKLLRVLQEKKIERVGGEKQIDTDVRIISATNRDLRTLVEEGTFREDLFYRLCVVPISLPPLRNRIEDIPIIANHILERIREESGKEIRMISDEAMNLLLAHNWPGNVRELINALQFGSVRCEAESIQPVHLPPEIRNLDPSSRKLQRSIGAWATPGPKTRKRKLDAETVRQALSETGGNKLQAAKNLGVGRATLFRFLKDRPI